jgi:hypothetical protein
MIGDRKKGNESSNINENSDEGSDSSDKVRASRATTFGAAIPAQPHLPTAHPEHPRERHHHF